MLALLPGTASAAPSPPAHDHAAHDHGAVRSVPPGFRKADPQGVCKAMFEVDVPNRTVCSHGPDGFGATAGFAEADPQVLGAEAGAAKPVPCLGDGTSGRRVEVLYVHASDVTANLAGALPAIRAALPGADDIVNASAIQTGGYRHIRYKTDSNCDPVVTAVTIPANADDTFGRTIDAVDGLGFNRSDRRYLMFVDADVYCGVATAYEDDSAASTNLNNGGTETAWSRLDRDCWTSYAATHELLHNIGAVNNSTPNSTTNGHCYDDRDVMCYDDDGVNDGVVHRNDGTSVNFRSDSCPPANESRLDCNHDDYFSTAPPPGSYLATHWNTAKSAFLTAGLPETPSRLTAAPEAGGMKLTWGGPPSTGTTAINDYVIRVYRGTTPVTTVMAGGPSVRTKQIVGLTDGVPHTFFVQAVSSTGRGPAAAITDTPNPMAVSITVPTRTPSHKPSTADPIVVHFTQPVGNVTTTNFVLRPAGGTTALRSRSLTCFSGTGGKVACTATTVRRAELIPAVAVVGDSYLAVLNPSGAGPVVNPSTGAALPMTTSATFVYELANEDGATFTWNTVRDTNALGGSYTVERVAGASASYYFVGTDVTWRFRTGPDYGTASVTMDGRSPTTVNLYRPTAGFGEFAYTGLVSRGHTIGIKVNGVRGDALGTDTKVSIDAFRTGDVTTNLPSVTYTWSRVLDAAAYDGGYAWTDSGSTTGPRANFKYRGRVVYVGFRSTPTTGRIQLFIDGALCGTYNTATSTAQLLYAGCDPGNTGLHAVRVVAIDPAKRVALDNWTTSL